MWIASATISPASGAMRDTASRPISSYTGIPGLSAELQGKLNPVKPETLGQAQRIPGMTPAALSLLLVQLSKRRRVA